MSTEPLSRSEAGSVEVVENKTEETCHALLRLQVYRVSQEVFREAITFEEHDRDKRVKCPKCGSEKVERVIGEVFAKTSKKS